MRKEVSLILDSLTEAAEDDFVFVSEMRYKDYVIEFFKDTQDGKYYWQADYDGNDRKLGNFNIWVTTRGISLCSEDDKGYLTKEDVVSKATEWVDKQKRKWNDSLTEAADIVRELNDMMYAYGYSTTQFQEFLKDVYLNKLTDKEFNKFGIKGRQEVIDYAKEVRAWKFDSLTEAADLTGKVVMYDGFPVRVLRKLTKQEKQKRAHLNNPDAGDYYEVEATSKALGTSRYIAWERDLTPIEEERILVGGNKMNKERDIQTLEKITELLREAFKSVIYEIEDVEEIFNSDKAIEVISKYSTINASLDELLYELVTYFEELAFIHGEE